MCVYMYLCILMYSSPKIHCHIKPAKQTFSATLENFNDVRDLSSDSI